MKYRAEIDGLRALAVISVVMYHAGIELFSGGFVGVDVFFVISGYLITTIIISELEEKKFSILNFYERRARRILPALFFHILVAIPFVFFLFPPHGIKDFFQSVFASALFISNIFFYIETDYFNDFSESAPLLHTWSLSVEEQFYIFFPLLLIGLSLIKRKPYIFPIICLCVLSLLLSEKLLATDMPLSFYSTLSRFWELGMGSILAIGTIRKYYNISHNYCQIGAALGFLLVFFPMFFYSKNTPFPGLNALVPVAGTILILTFSNHDVVVKRILSIGFIRYIGLISYSLYLSHNIVFAIFRNSGLALNNISTRTIAIGISLSIAVFSYIFVEQKFRKKSAKRITILISSLLGIFVFSSIGYFGHKQDGFKKHVLLMVPEEKRKIIIDIKTVLESKHIYWREQLADSENKFSSSSETRNILILGDSKSEDLYVSYKSSSQSNKLEVRRMRLDDICMDADIEALSENCKKEYKKVVDSELFKNASTLILTATWQFSTNKNVAKFVERISSLGKTIIILSTAHFNDVASLSYVISKKGYSTSQENDYIFSNIREDWQRQYESLRSTIETMTPKVKFIEKLTAFCELSKNRCKLRNGSQWYIYDTGHLTVEGAKFLGEVIIVDNWFSSD